MRRHLPALVVALLFSSFCIGQNCPVITHNPFTNFNSTPKAPTPSSLWLNIHTKLANTNLVNNGDYLLYSGGTITLTGVSSTPAVSGVVIPNGKIVADNTVVSPTTSYDMGSNTWVTKVPPGYSSSDIFISGAIITSSTGFTVGAGKASTITGSFFSNRPSFKQAWFYGIGAYQPPFDYSAIGGAGQVVSVGGGVQAGTPIPEKAFLVAGGSGGGGSNFTGSYSSTDNYMTCQQVGCSLGATIQKTDVSCNGSGNGSATVTITGGTAPFAYSNNGGVFLTTSNAVTVFSNLQPGTYPFTITDAAGCSVDRSVTILPGGSVQVSAVVVNGDFQNSCDGKVTITVTGGVAPFTYVWSDGVTTTTSAATLTRANLCGPAAGSGVPVQYTVVVTDANGCQGSTSFLIDVSSSAPAGVAGGARAGVGAQLGQASGLSSALLYPNPSKGIVHVQINSGVRGTAVVSVIDMSGRVVKTMVVSLEKGVNTKDLQLPVRAGFYMLQIRTSGEVKTMPVGVY